jgi:hypothetical protein
VAVLPQEHKQLGPADTFDAGVFYRRQLDGGATEMDAWETLLVEGKEDGGLPCYHFIEKYSTDVLGADGVTH